MNLRKRRSSGAQASTFFQKRARTSSHSYASSTLASISQSNPTDSLNSKADEEVEPTIFDTLHIDCLYEILDWLSVDHLCELSVTCKSLQLITKTYFRRKYPSQEFTAGDEFIFSPLHMECFGNDVQELRLYDSNLADFHFAGSNVNRHLRQIEFDRTYKQDNKITTNHINQLSSLLENIKTIRAANCEFQSGCVQHLLDKCKHIEDFSFMVDKNYIKGRLQLNKCTTLRNVELQFHAKVNVLKAIEIFKEEHLKLEDLVLMISKEHNPFMTTIFDELDSMHENGYFKRLFLAFEKKSMLTEHLDRLNAMMGLHGLNCSYTINGADSNIEDIAELRNIKYLNISWFLGNADLIAQQLLQLNEIEISVASIDAIVSFVRYSVNLTKFHIDQIRTSKDCNVKFDAAHLDRERTKLQFAKKLVIYIPETKYIKLKWSMTKMSSNTVEFRREESNIPHKRLNERVETDQ